MRYSGKEISDECTKCGKVLECELFKQGHGIKCERENVSLMVKCQMEHRENRIHFGMHRIRINNISQENSYGKEGETAAKSGTYRRKSL